MANLVYPTKVHLWLLSINFSLPFFRFICQYFMAILARSNFRESNRGISWYIFLIYDSTYKHLGQVLWRILQTLNFFLSLQYHIPAILVNFRQINQRPCYMRKMQILFLEIQSQLFCYLYQSQLPSRTFLPTLHSLKQK